MQHPGPAWWGTPGTRPVGRAKALLAGLIACGISLLGGCTAPNPDYRPDWEDLQGRPDLGGGDLAQGDMDPDSDMGPRTPWQTINPMPKDSDIVAVHGASMTDFYVITAEAVIHRVNGGASVEWRGKGCLRGVYVIGSDAVAAGGCDGNGLLLVRRGGGAWKERQLPNVELSGIWAQRPEEIYIASPSLGVVRLLGDEVRLERTVIAGEIGRGPVALWGTSPTDLYAVGGGRVLRRRGVEQWDTERNISGEDPVAVWGSGSGDVYVVGSTQTMGMTMTRGMLLHRRSVAGPFMAETIDGVQPQRITAVWGNAASEVYAAGDGGLVLLRAGSGRWAADRPGSVEGPITRALWGSGAQNLYAVGPGGITRRRAGPVWENVLGQSLTGVTLRGAALTGARDGLVVGHAGVILRQAAGLWQREAAGLVSVALNGVAAAPDGAAYAVGERGVVLRRDGGAWAVERPAQNEPGLLAVAAAAAEVYAVGEGGTILVRRGGVWRREPAVLDGQGQAVDAALRAVAVMPDGAVLAAGDQGAVVTRAAGEAGFRLLRSDPAAGVSLTGLAVLPDGNGGAEAWASASGGALVLRIVDGRASVLPAPVSEASALWGRGLSDVYLAGLGGDVWRWGGARWQAEPAPRLERLYGIHGAGETVLAVGEHGLMIQRD